MKQFNFIKIATAFGIGATLLSANALAENEKAIWEKAGFKNPEIVTLKTSSEKFSIHYTHELSMSVVMFRYSGDVTETLGTVDESGDQIVMKNVDVNYSGWSYEVTEKSMTRVAEIYSQCGIKIDNVKLVMVDAPTLPLTDFSSYHQLLTKTPNLPRPTVFLVRDRLNEDNEPSAGHAYRFAMYPNDIVSETAWISGIVNTDYLISVKEAGFSTLAHELAHIIANAEHIDYEGGMNLLGGTTDQQNSVITKLQCEKMKKHPSVQEIFTRNPAGAEMTENEFNSAIDEIAEMLRPAVESHKVKFVVEKNWSVDKDDASADQSKDVWSFVAYGGVGRHPVVTRDVLQLVVCHEIGHLLGGYPFYEYGGPSASEGQSDTFATQVCLPMAWAKQKDVNAKFRTSVDPYAKKMCDQSWKEQDRRDLCYRITVASYQAAVYVSDGDATEFALPGNPPLAFNTPDPTEPRDTIVNKLYSAQCRLDSMFQASLCDAKFDIYKIPGLGFPDGARGVDAEKEAAKYSCTVTKNNETYLSRPRCWFVPRNLN